MKLSIWQQFSSNHSSFFFIVGVFPSNEDAKHAQSEIQEMLNRIGKWYRENPDYEKTRTGPVDKPLPPEQEIAEMYDIKWPQTLDWIVWTNAEHVSDTGHEMIGVTQNVIYVQNPEPTWNTMYPWKGLLEYFGATTLGFDINHEHGWEKWRLRLTCTAPDEETANKLHSLPDNLKLNNLQIVQNETELKYIFNLTGKDTVGGLGAVLRSNGCENIYIDLVEVDEE